MLRRFTPPEAEELAVRALGHLAADPERLEPFLAVSGLGPATLRAAAADPGFLLGVLDHLCADEGLLIGFAAELGIDPGLVAVARGVLAGDADDPEP